MASVYDEFSDGGISTSGFAQHELNKPTFFPQTRSARKGVCSSKDRIPKATVIAMYPESSSTRNWLEGLTDDQWTVTSFNALNRQVCIDVLGRESQILNTLTLTLPPI